MQKGEWDNIIFFKGLGNPDLAQGFMDKMREYTGRDLNVRHINYHKFVDGELDDLFANGTEISGKTVVFFECLKEENIMLRFLQLCWAAKGRGAKRIVAVISFLHYRRQDRPEKQEEIHRNLWLIEMMKKCGVDDLIVTTPHSDRTRLNCESVGINFRAVDPSEAFASVLRPLLPEENESDKTVVYAPDEGSIPRACVLAKHLGATVQFSLKHRGFDNETAMVDADQDMINAIVAKYQKHDISHATPVTLKGMYVVMVEDEVDTAGTATKQGRMVMAVGIKASYFCFTHPVFSDGWKRKLLPDDGTPFGKILATNTIPRGPEKRTGGQIHDVNMAGLIASAVFRLLRS